jgi:hypothetical protein
MSTIKNPVGPEQGKVYWRRRVVVLLGLIAVIAIVVLIIVRPGSGGGPADAAAGVNPTPTPATTTQSTPQPGSVDVPPSTDKGGEKGGEPAACAAENIIVTPVTDADTYEAGVIPQLSFSLTNNGPTACSLDVGTAKQVYTIKSGDESYWVSTDCQTNPSDTPAVIDPGVTLTSTPFPWDRTRSAADTCAVPDRLQVPAAGASYHLSVSVGGFDSKVSKQFILN